MNKAEFEQTITNYRQGVGEILPGYVAGRLAGPDALADELGLVLYSRDVLARALAAADPLAAERLSEIERLDRELLALKDRLLLLAPFYASLRIRKPRPRSQWWYYLDEIVSVPPPAAPGQIPSGYWLPLTPQPAGRI